MLYHQHYQIIQHIYYIGVIFILQTHHLIFKFELILRGKSVRLRNSNIINLNK
jgi:hypothetical protein